VLEQEGGGAEGGGHIVNLRSERGALLIFFLCPAGRMLRCEDDLGVPARLQYSSLCPLQDFRSINALVRK